MIAVARSYSIVVSLLHPRKRMPRSFQNFARAMLRVCVPDTAFPEAEGVVQALGLESRDDGPILEDDGEGAGILPA